jgi:hypothetical protein
MKHDSNPFECLQQQVAAGYFNSIEVFNSNSITALTFLVIYREKNPFYFNLRRHINSLNKIIFFYRHAMIVIIILLQYK